MIADRVLYERIITQDIQRIEATLPKYGIPRQTIEEKTAVLTDLLEGTIFLSQTACAFAGDRLRIICHPDLPVYFPLSTDSPPEIEPEFTNEGIFSTLNCFFGLAETPVILQSSTEFYLTFKT